ncbi:hypothetical protein [Wolbachia endosymbiont (group A) of Ectemnius continuus]|uniref:hypothetical protein n=1 Tax=Wolbachia endosymbiont (group A) of Ectemnius continuus TaxID=2954002 RepID=UPI00222E59C4|nr:hypothetical protein [Wolbachia endosymbiont (group A) of Ectemnius continuus]
MTSLDFVKGLVNAFNVSNYGSKVNTNFVVEGDNIVINFNCDKRSAERYLSQMARDLVREYFSDESVARHAFDLGSLPFDFDKGRWTHSKAGTQLTVPIDSGVIFNLKVHFAEGFKMDVKNQMIKAIDEKNHLGKKSIEEALNKSIKQVKMDPSSGYIKCLLFNSTNVQTYFVGALQAKMQEYGHNYLNFYDIDYKNKKIYFKDVENIGFVRSVTELYKERSGYYFRFPSDDDLKVRKYKDAMGDLIFDLTKIPIYGYYRDNFIDEGRISNGDRFAFIPITKDGSNFRYLTYMEADKINAKFSHDLFTNVRGQTKDTESDEFGEVYALSDRQIALLIPVIIENSVINKDGQIEIDPGLYEKLQAPPTKLDSPRHESGVLRHNVGAAEVVAAKNVQADWDQPVDAWSFQASSAVPSLWQPSGPSSSEDANKSMRTGNSTWYVSSSHSPSVEDVNDVEPEKQQVSDECSEAKSQESESPKKHGVSLQRIKNFFFSPSKPKQHDASFKRCDVGRDTTRSIPAISVTEKPPVSKPFFSFPIRIRAKSNPSSKVTSPVHSTINGSIPGLSSQGTTVESNSGLKSQKRLDPDQREELRPFLSPELQNKLNSNSFSPEEEQRLYLMYTLSGKRELRLILSPKEIEQLNLCKQSPLPQSEASSTKSPVKEIEARQLLLDGSKIDDSGYSSMPAPASPAVRRSEESSKERNISPVHSDVAGSQESLLEGCNVKQHTRSYLVERVWEAFEK